MNPVLSFTGLIRQITRLHIAHTTRAVSLSNFLPSGQFLQTSLYVLNTPVSSSSSSAT